MKTAFIIDVDNIHERDIELALTFYTPDTKFFAVGLSALDMQPRKGNSPLNINKNKFACLRRLLAKHESQMVLVPNDVCMAESTDIRIAKLMGQEIIGRFDQCVVLSNDHSMIMMSIVLKQLMPTWVLITRPEHGQVLRKTNARMNGVSFITPKKGYVAAMQKHLKGFK